jgi:hypothetical protein|tara:strand:- start:270 stop:641 length:372 start_codon:yes stop_codon:yes gene_type:complete
MAKQMYSMRNFSGGINNDMDGRDIKENEFVHMQGFMTDQNGALRPVITSAAHDGLVNEKSLGTDNIPAVLEGSGGYNLGYFETDSILASAATVTGTMIFNDGGRVTFSTSVTDPQEETTEPPG